MIKVCYSCKDYPHSIRKSFERELKFSISDDRDKVVIKASKNISIEMSYDSSLLNGNINSLAKKVIKDYHSKIKKESIVNVKIISIKQ
jgi:hypothetical protein